MSTQVIMENLPVPITAIETEIDILKKNFGC